LQEIGLEETMTQEEEKKKKKKLLLLLLLLLLLIGLVWTMFSGGGEPAPFVIGDFPGMADADAMDSDRIQELAERHLDEMSTMINIFPEITVGADGISAIMWVQNAPTNDFGQNVILRLDGNDTILFQSGVILPGYQINQIQLTQSIPSGEHQGLITLEFYDLETEELLGTTTVEVRIIVD